MDEKLEYVNGIITSCFTPKLLHEIGHCQLQPKVFDEFRSSLDVNLIKLFDFIQQNTDLLESSDDSTIEFRANLILLLCEQSAPGTLYQTYNENLIRNMNVLLTEWTEKLLKDAKVEEKIFEHYRERLKIDLWKLHLGPAHGFTRFLEMRYGKSPFTVMDSKWSTFALSVGLLFVDFYEPSYKEIGLKTFNIILDKTPKTILQQVNIHHVIYEEKFKQIQRVNSATAIKELWEGLYKCLEHDSDMDMFKWNKSDELIKILLDRVGLSTKVDICMTYLSYVPRITARVSLNKGSLEDLIKQTVTASQFPSDMTSVRSICSENTSYTSYRWVKRILAVLVAESNYLFNSPRIAQKLLTLFHLTYLVCIYPLLLQVIEPHLLHFFGKFPLVLMDVLQMHKDDRGVMEAVQSFLQTFEDQLKQSNYSTDDLNSYQIGFTKILCHEIFAQQSS